MKGLLIKDFMLLRNQKMFLAIIIGLGMAYTFVDDMMAFGTGYIIVMCAMFATNSIAYDEADNGNAFLFAMPFSRKEYVAEKYLYGIFTVALGAGFMITLNVIAITAKNTGGMKEMLMAVAATVLAGVLMMSLTFPLQFKFGSEKGRIGMIIAIMSAIFLIYVAKDNMTRLVVKLAEGLAGMSSLTLALLGACVVGMLLGISLMISLKIVEKKEF